MHKDQQEKDGAKYHLRYYDNWMDFVSMGQKVLDEVAAGRMQKNKCSSMEGGSGFTGSASLEEAISMAMNGWAEGRENMIELRGRLAIDKLLPNAKRLEVHYDVSGDEPDVDMYLAGEPEDMFTLQESLSSSHGKVVRILVNRAANCGVSKENIVRRGTAVMIAAETMVRLGYSIELSICHAVSGYRGNSGTEYHETFIPVLHAGDPVNLDTIAFMLIHPSVLRRLVFATEELEPESIRDTFGYGGGKRGPGGYGRPRDPQIVSQECDIFIAEEKGQIKDDNSILPYAKTLLEQVGIKVEDEEQW